MTTKREIKFRAFDKINKRFVSQSITMDLEVTIRFDGVFVSNDLSIDGTESGDRIILSQFTGLLDKNGKEIYEGDKLLKDGVGGYFEVVWNNDRWAMQDLGGTYDLRGSLEIIGNIYENSELTKKD